MHNLVSAFVATSLLAACATRSSSRSVAIAAGGVLIGVGEAEAALVFSTNDSCQASSVEHVLDGCLAPMFTEGIVGTVLVTSGLLLLVGTLLTESREAPERHPLGLDDRYAIEARLAAGAGNCTAVLAILDQLDGSRRTELEADPAIAACL